MSGEASWEDSLLGQRLQILYLSTSLPDNYHMNDSKINYCSICLEQVDPSSETECLTCGASGELFESTTKIRYEILLENKEGSSDSKSLNLRAGNHGREGGFRVSTVSFDTQKFPITTGDYLPGCEVSLVVGVIFSSSSRKMGLTTTNVASNAFKDAFQDMQLKAKRLGADGVVSLLVSIERAGPSAIAFTQTVALTGTAVKFKK